jgi:hypothetical protein
MISFSHNTLDSLNNFIDRYHLSFTLRDSGSAADQLSEFFSSVSTRIDGPIFVIIDEYDHFANELLSFNLPLFQGSVSRDGYIRKWYEVLKRATKTTVEKIFVTGVSPITLDSLTSGFNIADDLTRFPMLNEMMGFTEYELKKIILETIVVPGTLRQMIDTLQVYYNGYLFSEDAITRIYNSDMILYYLKQYQIFNEPPKKLLDSNISSDYGKLGKLLKLKSPVQNFEVVKEIVYSGIVTTQMTEQFSMEKTFTKDDFTSLLFYLGLLTIRESLPGEVSLQIPNYVIRGLYYDFFMDLIAREAPYQIEPERI